MTKFQRVQRKWTNGSVSSVCLDLDLDQIYTPAIPTGASSVMDLTQRFTSNNNLTDDKDNGLKRVVSDQFKQIHSLRQRWRQDFFRHSFFSSLLFKPNVTRRCNMKHVYYM